MQELPKTSLFNRFRAVTARIIFEAATAALWLVIGLLFSVSSLSAQSASENGRYTNPIIPLDYSDPDVIRVGDDFYLTASSFNCVPGLPILHSRDMVNWKLINHALTKQPPFDVFDKPQHGNGVWAPSIRWHDGWFYIFYGDPDFGIYMVKAKDPAGEWTPPHLVRSAKGWIDPCPFWDEDGRAYLVHAFAGSRAGIKSIVVLHEMASDGTRLLDDGVLVFDGHEAHGTIEGTKMHKRNGYYYILAPAGGVSTGWQTILRSRQVWGPYEDKVVLEQGNSTINGPHQGSWVETASGEDWFFHFQELQPYGRIVHLQPARWENDWLEIGVDKDGDGIGEPVMEYAMPDVGGTYPATSVAASDDFNNPKLGLQWQWQANPEAEWAFPTALGFMRMNPVVLPAEKNLWEAPNPLLQKMPAGPFTATTKVTFHAQADGETTGLLMMGRDYAHLSIRQENGGLVLQAKKCIKAESGAAEQLMAKPIALPRQAVYLRVTAGEGGVCTFSYSLDNEKFQTVGTSFQAREGKWIGAKIGIFASREAHQNDGGYADYDWFSVQQ